MKKLWFFPLLLLFLLTSSCVFPSAEDNTAGLAAARAYIDDHWPNSDFQLETYPNLFGSGDHVHMKAVSAASPDTWFRLEFDPKNNVMFDYYDSDIMSAERGQNTLDRLETEYAALAEEALGSSVNLKDFFCQVILIDNANFFARWASGEFYLDIPFSPGMLDDGMLWVQCDAPEGQSPTGALLAEYLTEMDGLLEGKECTFSKYRIDITWRKNGKVLRHTEVIFPTCKLTSPDFVSVLDAYLSRPTDTSEDSAILYP